MKTITGIMFALAMATVCWAQQADDSCVTNFSGIGAVILVESNYPEVCIVFTNSPAQTSGLKPGDRIISIDDENVAGKPLSYVSSKLMGTEGTTVTIDIVPSSSSTTNRMTLTRARITHRMERMKELPYGDRPQNVTNNFTQGNPAEIAPMTEPERNYYKDNAKGKLLLDAPK